MSAVYECDFCHKTQKACMTITFNTHRWSETIIDYPMSSWGVSHTFDCCNECMQKVIDVLGIKVVSE